MEGERHYELRSRSRSRSMTPMVLLHNLNDIDVGEHHYDLRSRSRERSYTPAEVTSSRRSGTRSLTGSAGKNSEKAIDVIVESKDTSKVDNAINERRSESAASTNSSRRVERRSERQRVKRQIFSNGQIEKKKDSSDTDKILEKRKSVTPKRTITSDYSSEEGEKEDPPSRPGSAYEIYKQAGDWWNVFPKTDYTYSQTSQFRYEIAPGVLAMPNMSRPSIHSDGNSTSGSVNSLSQQNLSQFSRGTRESHSDSFDVGPEDAMESIEQNRLNEINASRKLSSNSNPDGGAIVYTKHFAQYQSHREIRYGDLNYRVNRRNRYNSGSQIDSDTEIDEALSMRPVGRKRVWKSREWLLKITQTLTIWFYSLLDFTNAKILRRGNNYAASQGYDRYRESNRSKFWETMSRTMHYFYLLLVRILFLDTWLLSRLSSARKQLRNRRSKILWLIFLPPFLLAGAYVAQKHSLASADNLQKAQKDLLETTNRIFNDLTNLLLINYGRVSEYLKDMKNLTLPSLPSVNVSVPSLKDIGWNVTW